MIRNPYDCFPKERSPKAILERRLDILADYLPYPKEEMKAWSLLYTLITASWSLTDHKEVSTEHIEIIKLLAKQMDVRQ